MEIIRFFKKLTLANCLNGVAMRMFRVCYNICYRMVIVAVHLDPNRSSFQNNLSALADVGDKSIKYKQNHIFVIIYHKIIRLYLFKSSGLILIGH